METFDVIVVSLLSNSGAKRKRERGERRRRRHFTSFSCGRAGFATIPILVSNSQSVHIRSFEGGTTHNL